MSNDAFMRFTVTVFVDEGFVRFTVPVDEELVSTVSVVYVYTSTNKYISNTRSLYYLY